MNRNVLRTSVFFDSDSSIAVCTPTIPPRAQTLLPQALASVHGQALQPTELHVVVDHIGRGAAAGRQAALDVISPGIEWVAFLDDDDYWYVNHLQTLARLAEKDGADFVYSWFDGNDPFPQHQGRQFDPADPHHTTMNIMVRASLARQVGFAPHRDANREWPGEDWRFIQGCAELGAKFAGTGEVTWHYRVHENNTSGLASRWVPDL